MKVQEVILNNGEKRYIVLDNNQQPIQAILLFMKYLDTTKKSPNTQRTYCFGLRDFFVYLSIVDIDYKRVTIKVISNFLSWMVNPTLYKKVTHMSSPALRTEKTINLKMSSVIAFYRFLYQFEYIDTDVAKQAYSDVRGVKKYKDFLYHINKNKSYSKNIFKLKEPRKKVQVIPDEILRLAFQATTNIRDLFLLSLLFESGLRIGEVLSIHKEDIIFDLVNGHRISLTNRDNIQNGARLKTGSRDIYISSDLIDLFDDYMYFISDFDKSEYLFVKIKGDSKGLALDYNDVSAVFKRLSEKIDYRLHPHLYRHTHATKYYQKTKDIKSVQERLGHKQIQTTMNLYLHPSEEEIRKQWEKAKSAFRMELK
ncbi:tyrosine-type recombinase/integrase [Vagococcus fluvialis]|uniref:tyrosine-type recombinase/integrase n=1 Tax=Vagococcus fluvialis TaxID=2738 RepID=UPI003D0D39C6